MKTADDKTQNEIIALVKAGKDNEAHMIESELAKNDIMLEECVMRLKQAETAGIMCSRENLETPFWIVNNKFLEQCFSHGWRFNEDRK